MPTYLGERTVTGIADISNPFGESFWTCTFDPAVFVIAVEFEIYHMAIKGPTGSQLEVFKDSTFYDNVQRGDVNSWDPAQPLAITPGQTLFFYWNTGDGNAPTATVSCRLP